MPDRPFSDAQIDAAVEALSDPARFREAESQVARVAPQLQRILNHALDEGGWFGEAHEAQVLKAATMPDPDERILAEALGAGGWFGESHEAEVLKAATAPDDEARLVAVRTLLAEETRIGMMVGVAVGWELRNELYRQTEDD